MRGGAAGGPVLVLRPDLHVRLRKRPAPGVQTAWPERSALRQADLLSKKRGGLSSFKLNHPREGVAAFRCAAYL